MAHIQNPDELLRYPDGSIRYWEGHPRYNKRLEEKMLNARKRWLERQPSLSMLDEGIEATHKRDDARYLRYLTKRDAEKERKIERERGEEKGDYGERILKEYAESSAGIKEMNDYAKEHASYMCKVLGVCAVGLGAAAAAASHFSKGGNNKKTKRRRGGAYKKRTMRKRMRKHATRRRR